jgi:hypothetical protein
MHQLAANGGFDVPIAWLGLIAPNRLFDHFLEPRMKCSRMRSANRGPSFGIGVALHDAQPQLVEMVKLRAS